MDNSNVTQLHPKDKNQKEEASLVSSLSPREIVSELDRFVVGQNKAKKAVAIALRNRWRRQALKGEISCNLKKCFTLSSFLCSWQLLQWPTMQMFSPRKPSY